MADFAAMSRGYIAVPRSIFTAQEFAAEPFSEREAFLSLVADAAWKPRAVRLRRGVVQLERGQLLGSTRYLAERWKWPEPRVRRFLIRISGRNAIDAQNDAPIDAQNETQSDALIDAQPTGDGTIITIRNYNSFQRSQRPEGAGNETQPDAQNETQSDAPNDALSDLKSTQREEEININNSPEGRGRARAKLIPEDFRLSDEVYNWALSKLGSEEAVQRSVDRFKNHYSQVAGDRALSTDWQARARNWIDDDAEKASRRPTPSTNTDAEQPLTEAVWDGLLKTYASTGHWSRHVDVVGPDPSSTACRAPQHLLAKHGLEWVA